MKELVIMIRSKKFSLYIQFVVICLFIIILEKMIYLREMSNIDIYRILFLDLDYIEMIVFDRFYMPFVAGFFVIIIFIFINIESRYVMINNLFYLTRFSKKKRYINYVIKNMIFNVFTFLIIEFIMTLFLAPTHIKIFEKCLHIVKLLICIVNVQFIYYFYILIHHKKNAGMSLFLIGVILLMDIFIKTSLITLSSDWKVSIQYFMFHFVLMCINYYLMNIYYKKNKEMREIL